MKKIKDIAQTINEKIPLHEIIGTRVELTKRGREWIGICPNPDHDDHGLGSFSVNSNKHIAKCFACGFGCNNGISFISEFDKVSRAEAILRIAVMANLITEKEYIQYSNEKTYSVPNKISISERIKDSDGELASIQNRNLVYSIFTEGKKLEGADSRLTDEHLDYLHKRGITDEEIEKYRYFSMPTRRAMAKIKKKISVFDSPDEILPYVPGFYFDNEKGWFTFTAVKGIGIPIRNDEGKIIAIQIRRDEVKEGQQRYLWWSSSFANDSMGASPGSPLDIVKPDEIKYSSLFITEGHFKAAVLANTFNTPVISVQGVGNWRTIREEIEYMKQYTKYIFICYDADMAHNTAVMKQAIQMAGEIKKNFPEIEVYFTLWDEKYGKGIDDMILAGHKKELIRMKLDKFAGLYCSYKADVDKLEKTDEEGRNQLFKKIFLGK